MKLILYASSAVLVVVCATWAYRVNYATQEAMNRVADLRAEIAREREALGVLEAEWAYLNRPDRLRALVDANATTLALVELTPGQFADVGMVSFPPPPDPTIDPETAPQSDPAGAKK
ncbi:cell division protein FtsL [Amaricoccus sp.]|uniref:cell division protein FtsL n=1 Tax=Amaricoccus sp. TaxID=1872485 RepID=UPI00262CB95E|nr:cell division protein FtsL [uncultured Amaricoccus sp.]